VSFGARAFIRLAALQHNFELIRARVPGARIMAMVKANAYGHGLVVVARALPGVDSFAVARLPEALELRQQGITQPLVLLSGVFAAGELEAAVEAGCEIVVHHDAQLALLEAHRGPPAVVWLKIDTGMNRLGFAPEQAFALTDRLRRWPAVRELRLMTHLANADDRDDARTAGQLEAFAAIAAGFDGPISIANSGGIFGWREATLPAYLGDASRNWIRPGIALYGISPFPDLNGADLGLRPVMQFESRLVAVKPVRKGDRVGYGGSWVADRDTTIGIVSAGYGDGYTRYLPSGTPVLVNGRRVPLAGFVSMDMSTVDLGPGAEDRVGDRVLLWGDDLPVEEIARQAKSLAYQLVCGVMNREESAVVDR